MNQRSNLLRHAERLVNGDRNRQYGDPKSDFAKTAALWEIYLNGTQERHYEGHVTAPVIIEPHDVAILMALLKISRLTWTPEKDDTWSDLAGYAACGWDCVEGDDIYPTDPITAALDEDEDFQNDIAVDTGLTEDEEAELYYNMLVKILNAPEKPQPQIKQIKGNQGFLGGSIFPKLGDR